MLTYAYFIFLCLDFMGVELVLAIWGLTPIYLPDTFVHESTGHRCNIELGGYYNRIEQQIYVCEGQGEFVVYHELGHHIFAHEFPDLYADTFKRYVDYIDVPNENELPEFTYYHELFASSVSRILRNKESIIEFEQELDILTKKLLILYLKDYYVK